ncbi:MAG TPA: tetratricopeptide repeat protein, partial [Candidatus Methanoperedens sp.]
MLVSRMPAATPSRHIFIIISVSIAIYFNALFNAFVFDDIFQVLENQWIRDIGNIPAIFSQSVWGFNDKASVLHYYRPLMHLIYMFNYHLFGLNPWGFHLVNILFHAGGSVLVYITAMRFLKEAHPSTFNTYLSLPFITAILFATHPIHTEVVAWVAAVPEIAFTFFFLLSFYLYMRSEDGSRSNYILSLVSYAFALLSKETALTLPIILVAYDFVLKVRPLRSVKEHFKTYIPYLIVTALYFVARSYGLRDVSPVKKVFDLSLYEYVINVFSFFMHYIAKLILPIHLNAYHIFHPITTILALEGLLALIISVAFIIIVVMALKKNKSVFFSLALVAVPLIPTFYIIGNSEVGISERYLYLPSFGFVLLLALLADMIRVKKPAMNMGLGLCLAVLICFYSMGTINRNAVWKDEYTYFTDTVKKSPDSAILHEALSSVLYNKGDVGGAIEESLQALKLNPNYAAAHIDLGAAYNKKGWLDNSAEHFLMALQLKPLSWEAYRGLGVTYLNLGRVDDAIEQLETSLRLNPAITDAHKNICIAYMRKGLLEKA